MESIIKLSLMLITLTVFGADGAGMIEDHGCVNLKGEYEQCGEFQYCSKSSLTKGCRDCEDIAERWCKLSKERISDFKKRFPKCGILCDLKELNETKEKLTKTENDLKASKREKAALESSGFRRLCPCLFTKVTGQAVPVETNLESFQPLNPGTQATPSAPPASELDSGNSSQNVSSDSLTSAGPPQEELLSTTSAGTSAGN
ncbi:hypothetical protein ACOMHN_039459 [Nucella lapillus]